MKTIKEIRQEIIEKYNAIPEQEVSTGVFIKTVGYKYVTLLNIWGTTSIEKVDIEEFYENYIR